jgi:hypothetical protein
MRTLMRTSSALTGIASTGTGQVLMIEDGRHVLMHMPGDTRQHRALSLTGRTLTGLAVDPLFNQTHFVYVGESRELGDGSREIAIVRYREVQGTLGDPAVVVPGIRVARGRSVPFSIDSSGHIVIATPESSSRDPYSAAILRFTRDGLVPSDARGLSPVLSQGLAEPFTLSGNGRHLWIAGRDQFTAQRLARLDLGSYTGAGSRRLAAVASAADGPLLGGATASVRRAAPAGGAFLLTSDGQAVRCQETACSRVLGARDLRFTAVTGGPDDVAYAAISTGDGVTALVELRRRASR